MNYSLENIKHAYFIGIGGVSMSSLASVLMIKGKKVSGYDMHKTSVTEKLVSKGASVSYDLESDIPDSVDTVVFTAAIKEDNPLMIKARICGAKVISRAELLGIITNSFKTSIGVAGTHGKSTTTGLLASVCLTQDGDSAILSGANLPFMGSSYKCGNGERIVYEACEYRNSYHSMIPSIKVVLNCEHDHVDFFPLLDDVIKSFKKYIDCERFPGSENISVINYDCKNCIRAAENSKSLIYRYSIKEKTDFYAYDIDMSDGFGHFSVCLNDGCKIENIKLQIPGIHNVSNAVAAAAAAYISGVSAENIKKGLANFTGVSRRFEFLGNFCGAKLIDDYAHHPDEICATLNAARNLNPKRIICVFQPHTYSRTHELLYDFARALSLADKVYLCDIYAAREKNESGVTSEDIAKLMNNAECPGSFDTIAETLKTELKSGDFCITMGAGEAYKVANILLNK